jgi:hypothetical protein
MLEFEKYFVDSKSFYNEYYDLINLYDNFNGKKMLIYYEELIKNNMIIKDIINFISPNNRFVINKEIIKQISKQSKIKYKNNDGLKTEDTEKLHNIFTTTQNNIIDNIFREHDFRLYDKYLIRYYTKL